eukprot:gb/GECG01006679.1/.p1 GENE.gb/GECG01006679.1/~~gb/GECG01006679.1/.p1  ORF type:complete len:2825 (+),score=332.81 gb/GECG01006679.1/:1-8475(+)
MQQIHEAARRLLHNAVQTGDKSNVFNTVPSPEQDPEYYRCIQEPMCFYWMAKKLERGMYTQTQEGLEDMRQDVRRIIRNAMKYYRPGSPMYTNARQLMDATLPNIDQFVDEKKSHLAETQTPPVYRVPEEARDTLTKARRLRHNPSSNRSSANRASKLSPLNRDSTAEDAQSSTNGECTQQQAHGCKTSTKPNSAPVYNAIVKSPSSNLTLEQEYGYLPRFVQSIISFQTFKTLKNQGLSSRQLEILFGEDPYERTKRMKQLEKTEQSRETIALLNLEGPSCTGCGDSRSFQDDPLLQCCACGICVHQRCAGVSNSEVHWILTGELKQEDKVPLSSGKSMTYLDNAWPRVSKLTPHHAFGEALLRGHCPARNVESGKRFRTWYCDPCRYGIQSSKIPCCLCPQYSGCFKAVDSKEETDVAKLLKKGKQSFRAAKIDERRYRGGSFQTSEGAIEDEATSVMGSLIDMVELAVAADLQNSDPDAELSSMTKNQFKVWALLNAPSRCDRPPKYWIHTQCATYFPEPKFPDPKLLSPVHNVKKVDVRRFELKCLICRQKRGACVQCNYGTCGRAFHVTCAQNNGHCLRFEWIDQNNIPELLGRFMLYCTKDDPRDGKDRRGKLEALERENYLRKRRYETKGMRLCAEKGEGMSQNKQQKLISKRREELGALLNRLIRHTSHSGSRVDMGRQSSMVAPSEDSDSDNSDGASTSSSSTDSLHSAVGGFDECGDESSDEEWDGSVPSLVRYMVDKRSAAYDADRHRDKSRFSRPRKRKSESGGATPNTPLPEDVDESEGTLSLVIRPRVAADIWPALCPYFIPVNTDVAKKCIRSVLPWRRFSQNGLPDIPLENHQHSSQETRITFRTAKSECLKSGYGHEIRSLSAAQGTPLHALQPPFYIRCYEFLQEIQKANRRGIATLMAAEPKLRRSSSQDSVEGDVQRPELSLFYCGRERCEEGGNETGGMSDRRNAPVDPDIAKILEEVVANVELECEGIASNRNYSNPYVDKQGVLAPISSLLAYEARSRKAFHQELLWGHVLTDGCERNLPRSLRKRFRLIDDEQHHGANRKFRRLELGGGGSPAGALTFRSAANDLTSESGSLKQRLVNQLANYRLTHFEVQRSYKYPVEPKDRSRRSEESLQRSDEMKTRAHDRNDTAFQPPRPLGKHFTQLWKEEDDAAGRKMEYDGCNVSLFSSDRGSSRRAASRLSMGVSLPSASSTSEATEMHALPVESLERKFGGAYKASDTPREFTTTTTNHFAGWGQGDDFSHLRQSYVADLDAYPPLLQMLNAAKNKGVCQNTEFRFATSRTRKIKLDSEEDARVHDSSLLNVINRVNKAFTCAADFQASLETKNEFTLVAEREGHLVGFINYYFMWFSQSKLGAGKRPPPERVMYVATLQAVKDESHSDLTCNFPTPKERHPTQSTENAAASNPGSEPRTGTLLFALACQHALCVGITSALCDSTPEAVEYYLRIFNMHPTTMSVDEAHQRALEGSDTNPAETQEENSAGGRGGMLHVGIREMSPVENNASKNLGEEEVDTEFEDSPRGSPIDNDPTGSQTGNCPSRAAVPRAHANSSRYVPLHLHLQSDRILRTVHLGVEDLESRCNEKEKPDTGITDIAQGVQEDEIADEISVLQNELRSLMHRNDTKSWKFVSTVDRETNEEESQWKTRSFYRRAWRAWKREARRRAIERQRAMQQAEEDLDAVCSICHGGDSHPANQIVFCESCNLAVHQRCYGVIAIPEGDWFCDVCAAAGGAKAALQRHTPLHIPCVACGVSRGAMKATDAAEGRRNWIHVVCARLAGITQGPVAHVRHQSRMSRVHACKKGVVRDACPIVVPASSSMEPIRGVEPNSMKGWFARNVYCSEPATCSVCKLQQGLCVPCQTPGCSHNVHPYCALARGLLVAGAHAKEEYITMWQKYLEECTMGNAGRTLRKDTKGFRSTAPLVASQDLARAFLQSSIECSPEAVDALRKNDITIDMNPPSSDLEKAPKWLYTPSSSARAAATSVAERALSGESPILLVFCTNCREPTAESKEPVQKLRLSAALQEQREKSHQDNFRNARRKSGAPRYDWKNKLLEKFELSKTTRSSREKGGSVRNAEKELELPGINALKQFLGYPGFSDESQASQTSSHGRKVDRSSQDFEPVNVLVHFFPGIPLYLFPRELCERAYQRIQVLLQQPSLLRSALGNPEVELQKEQRMKQPPTTPKAGEFVLRQVSVRGRRQGELLYLPLKPMYSDPHSFHWSGGKSSGNVNVPKNTDSYWRSRLLGTDLIPFCPAKLTPEAFIAAAKKMEQIARGWTREYGCVDDIVMDWQSIVSPGHKKSKGQANAYNTGSAPATVQSSSQSRSKADLVVIHTNEKGEQIVRNTSEEDRVPLCVCRKPYLNDASPMIACSSCDEWFHFHCLGLEPATQEQIRNGGKNPEEGEWYYHSVTDVLVDARGDIWCPWCEPRLAPWRGLFSLWGYRGDDVFFPTIEGITDRQALYQAANKAREEKGLPPLLGSDAGEGMKGVDGTAYAALQIIRINGHALVRKYNPFTGGFTVNREDKIRRTHFNVGGAGGIFGSPYNTPPWKLWDSMRHNVNKEHLRQARDFWMKQRALRDQIAANEVRKKDDNTIEIMEPEVSEPTPSGGRGKRRAATEATKWLSETMRTGKKPRTDTDANSRGSGAETTALHAVKSSMGARTPADTAASSTEVARCATASTVATNSSAVVSTESFSVESTYTVSVEARTPYAATCSSANSATATVAAAQTSQSNDYSPAAVPVSAEGVSYPAGRETTPQMQTNRKKRGRSTKEAQNNANSKKSAQASSAGTSLRRNARRQTQLPSSQ